MPNRPLSESELFEARLVFGGGLDFARVQVSEGGYLPNFIADVGALLQGRRRTVDNAVTLGATSHFPRALRTTSDVIAQGDLLDICWLIHELTHQWQYQHYGWRYLIEATSVQIRMGMLAYNYVGAHGSASAALQAATQAGQRFADFNREQQGDIVRDYYFNVKHGQDVSAWTPFMAEVRVG